MLFLITIFMGLLYFYVTFRGINLMSVPAWLKIVLLVLLLPGVFDIVIVLAWGAKMPQWLISLFATAGLALIYLAFGILLSDFIRWIYRPIPNLISAIVCIALILACFATYNATRLPFIHEITIHSPSLPQNWRPLKIVQLSDLHIGQGFTKKRLQKIVEQTNSLKPDLILITGDSVDQSIAKLGEDMQLLGDLDAPTYMVFGNHEYYHGPSEWQVAFEKMGIRVLKNRSITLDNKGQKYVLGGADFGGWLQKNQISHHLKETFEKTDETLPRLLLVHYPTVFDEAIKHNVSLQLSGHTHGGMTPPISWITRLFNGGYVRGLYQKGKSTLYVSDGTGLWTGMPARLGSANEIVVIHWIH